MTLWRGWWLALALAAAVPRAAWGEADAQPSRSVDAARAHFHLAVELYHQGKYDEAVREFEAANRERPHAAIFFNLAQCYERLGNLSAALGSYQEYLRQKPDAEDRTEVEQAMSALEKRMAAHGLQAVSVDSRPTGAEVWIDSTRQGPTPWRSHLPAGDHLFEVHLDGFAPASRTQKVIAGVPLRVDFDLVPTAKPAEAGVTPAASPAATALATPKASEATQGNPSPHHLWSWVTLGVGAASAATALGFGISAKSASDRLLDGQIRAKQTAQTLHDQASGRALTSNVLWGLAGAAAIGGGALFFVEGGF